MNRNTEPARPAPAGPSWLDIEARIRGLVREALEVAADAVPTQEGLANDAAGRYRDLLEGTIRALDVARMPVEPPRHRVRCECEHLAHTGTDAEIRERGLERSHPYVDESVHAVSLAVTPYGNYPLCDVCVSERHLALDGLVDGGIRIERLVS